MPTQIIFGVGSVAELGKEANKLGKKVMVVTYPDIRKTGLLDKILEDLKTNEIETAVFEEVEPNPRSSTIDRGAKLAREEKVNIIIGLGGGSAMDTAKGMAIASTGTDSIWDYVERKAQPKPPVPILVQVPTMAGTGSEINGVAVVTNWETHVKSLLMSPFSQANVSIIDPEVTLTVPRKQTKAGGFDTFCHIVEAYLTDGAPTPLTDGIRETVMKMVVKYLPQALAKLDDIEARTQLSWASTMAMSSFVRLGGGGGGLTLHGVEHALSGLYDVTHGEGLAALLPAWMRFTLPDRKDRFELLGKNVFGKEDGLAATEDWMTSVDMKMNLPDLGCEPERAEEIADLAVKSSPWLGTHPTPIDAKVAAEIYRDAF